MQLFLTCINWTLSEHFFPRFKRDPLNFEKMDFFHSFLNHARNARFSIHGFQAYKKGPFRAHVLKQICYIYTHFPFPSGIVWVEFDFWRSQ